MNINELINWGLTTLPIINNAQDFSEAEKAQASKLEWLKSQQTNLEKWDEYTQIIRLTEQTVRLETLTLKVEKQLKKAFAENLAPLQHDSSTTLKEEMLEFVKNQSLHCAEDERLLGSTEIIESVFGKQKQLEQNYAKEGFTSLILGIGAFVGEMTHETIEEALTNTPVKTIVKWCKEELGKTLQSKKKEAYSKVKNGTKVKPILCESN